jgi:hypothetical protein
MSVVSIGARRADTAVPAARAVVLLPALLAVLLYLPVQRTGLLSDDYSLLFAFHPAVTGSELVARVAGMFAHGVGAPSFQYRPVTMATFALNVARGPVPLEWHLVNLLLHAANAALLASLALRVGDRAPGSAAAALMAGVALALLPPAVEAVAWPAARFDALALFFILLAARAATASVRPLDRASLAGLAAFALALGSKEAGVLALPLAGALLWQREARRAGVVRGALAALGSLLPWLAVAAAYFLLRHAIFGDAVRFFPGASPLAALGSGAFFRTFADTAAWWPRAFPEAGLSAAYLASAAGLAVLALAAALRERDRAAEFVPMLAATLAAATILAAQWRWPANGEGGRVLYTVGAIALLMLIVPLRARAPALRRGALLAAIVLVLAGAGLAGRAVDRWHDAGASMLALIAALAQAAHALPPGEFAYVLVDDHVGSVPFARNAQAALMLPPVQAAPLSSRLIVQTRPELGQWPGLVERDLVPRLMREPLLDVLRSLSQGRATDPPRLPDRYYCWHAARRTLEPLAPALPAGLQDWEGAWQRVLEAGTCGERPT